MAIIISVGITSNDKHYSGRVDTSGNSIETSVGGTVNEKR